MRVRLEAFERLLVPVDRNPVARSIEPIGRSGQRIESAWVIPGQAAVADHGACLAFGHGARREQARRSLGVGIAGLPQHVARVLAGERRAPVDLARRLGELDRKPRRLHAAFGRMVVLDEGAVVLDLRVFDQFGVGVDRTRPRRRSPGRAPAIPPLS